MGKKKMKKKMALKLLSSDAVSVALARTMGVSPKKARKLLANGIINCKRGAHEPKPARFNVTRGKNGIIFGGYDDAPKEDHSVEGILNKIRKNR